MIFDHRTYTCKPGTIKTHLDLYAKMGFAPQSRLLGKPVLYGTTEVGDVNSYVHVWACNDLADRTAKRAAMWDEPNRPFHDIAAGAIADDMALNLNRWWGPQCEWCGTCLARSTRKLCT